MCIRDSCKYELRDTQSAYAALRRRCEPFLQALKYFPQFAKGFAEKIADLLEHREAQQKKEREEAKRNPHRACLLYTSTVRCSIPIAAADMQAE